MSIIIAGTVVRKSNQQAIPKLYVEVWDTNSQRKEQLASTITDGNGAFMLTLNQNFIGELYKDHYPDVYFKVFAGNTLIASTDQTMVLNLRGITKDLVIAVDYQSEQEQRKQEYLVKGQILQTNFLPAANAEIELCDKGIVNDTVITHFQTDETGYFEARFSPEVFEKSGKQTPDLFLRVIAGKEVKHNTSIVYNASPVTEFKEVIGGAAFPKESEFELLNRKLSSLLRNVPVNNIRFDKTKNPYRLLAQKTAITEQQVKWMVMAQQLSQFAQLPASFWYALLRSQLAPDHVIGASALVGASPDQLLSVFENISKNEEVAQPFVELAQQPEAIVNTLSLLPAEAVPNAIDYAIRNGIVPAQLIAQKDELLRQWSALAKKTKEKSRNDFKQLISSAQLDENGRKQIEELFDEHNGNIDQLLGALENDPSSSGAANELKTVVALNEVVKDPQTAASVKSKLRISQPEEISRLAGLSEKDWQTITGDGSSSKWSSDRISQIRSYLEKQYPTAAFAGKLKADKQNGFVNKEHVLDFFDTWPQVELHKTNFDSFFRNNADVIGSKFDNPKALKSDLKKIQRIFRLAPDYETTKSLIDKNITSSHSVYALGKKRFAATMSDKLSKQDANKIYKKAERSYAASLAIMGEFKSLQNGSALNVLPDVYQAYEEVAMKEFPDLKSLFKGTEDWECKDCKNVYSPAAYLTDLLKYLDKRGSTTPMQSAKKVLFKRRPDIGEIDLNCNNSQTAIPYLDLVCEVLEDTLTTTSFVLSSTIEPLLTEGLADTAVIAEFRAKNLDLDAKAAITVQSSTTWFVRDDLHTYKIEKTAGQLNASLTKQTHGTAAERKAMPEFINYSVYDSILKNEKHPFTLPFDLSWEETRAYLSKLDIDRAQWMQLLQNKTIPSPADVQVACEFLGIAPTEKTLITTADTAGQATYWGGLTAIDTVSVFLKKSGLDYKQLLYLLELKFINPAPDSKVVHHDTTANLDNKTISNLDNNKLDRIHRFLRLWRKTDWQLWELDRVLMNAKIGNTGQLQDTFLVNLKNFIQLKRTLNKSVEEILAWYEDLNTKGNKSLYNALFQNKIILNPLPDALKLVYVTENPFPNPAPNAPDGSPRTISGQVKSIAAVLKLKEEDVNLIKTNAALSDDLSLANLSAIYRIASLTQKLRLSINEYYVLSNILSTPVAFDSFAEAASTQKFIDTVAFVRDSKFSVYELAYLLMHTNEGPRPFIPSDDLATAFITKGRTALQKINDELSSLSGLPDEKAKALIQKIATIDEDAANTTTQIFNGSYTGTTAARDTFIDASYSFLDTTAIKAKLNTRDAAPAADKDQKTLEAWQSFVDQLTAYLSNDLAKQAVFQVHQDQFKLAPDVSKLLLEKAHLSGTADALLSYWFDPNFLAKDNTGNYVKVISIANFPDLYSSYQLLNKIALLQTKLPLSPSMLDLLLSNAATLNILSFDELPLSLPVTNSGFDKWQNLVRIFQFSQAYPDTDTNTLTGVLQKLLPVADTEVNFLQALAGYTLWDKGELTGLKTELGLVYPADYLSAETYTRLDQCMNLIITPSIKAAQIALVINAAPVAADAIAIKQLVKSKYQNDQWLNTSANIQAIIRERKRDALVAYFTSNTINGNTFADANELYSFYLLDTEMGSKEVTARILQANLSIPLFVQRCLMNLEAEIVADAEADEGWLQWEWMKYYQVWAANRKVFLYPENWIEPELRLDKSVFFEDLENDLMQNEVTKTNVENAFMSYLEKLDNVARLDVSGFYYDEETYTLHVFARTYDDPHIYYYRKWVEDRYWTPWEKLDLEINTTQVIPVVINRRLYLYWPEFREQSVQPTSTNAPNPGQNNFPVDQPYKFWEIHLSVSELRNGKWTPKKISKTAITTWQTQNLYGDYPKENFSFLPIDLMDLADRYLIGCYLNTDPDDATDFYNSPVNFFDLGSCHGTPEILDDYMVKSLISQPIIPQFERSELQYLESHESTTNPNDALAFQQGNLLLNHVHILEKTPGWFRTPQSAQLSFFDKLLLKLYAKYYGNTKLSNREFRFPHTVGTFLPFFYEDKGRTFFVPQEIILYKRRTKEKDAIKGEFFYSDIIKIIQEIQRTGQLPDILKPYFADGQWPMVRFGLKFSNFYHPHVCFMIKQLYKKGIDGIMKRDLQMLDQAKYPEIQNFDFRVTYEPTPVVTSIDTRVVANTMDPDTTNYPGYPKENIDFNAWGSYAQYNWELFYHAPMLIAQRLSNNQQFEDAMHWYHYIFNPTDASALSSPQRFWNTKPFYLHTSQDYLNQRIDQILKMIDNGDTELIKDVDDWRKNPFQPHRIAQFRTVAYQKNTVMKYLDNLVAWADNLYRTDTRENITAATQLYILAAEILGPKPKVIPNFFDPPILNYNQLETKLDAFSNALVDLENFIPFFSDDVQEFDNGGAPLPDMDMFYFCLPPNEKLMSYYDTIGQRLFNIRHSMNIDGIERELALYDPPIDPGLLVKAVGSGLSISAAIAGLNAPLPNYRFSVCLQKAIDFCNEVRSLGSSLLSALEKRDVEALALLRSSHEIRMYEAVKDLRKIQIEEAQANIDQLNKAKAVTQEKLNYYSGLEYMNAGETVAFALSTASTVLDAAIAAGYILAGGLKAIPQFVAGGSGFGGSPHVTISIGGQEFGDAAEIATKTISAVALALDKGASLASTQGSYQRRKEEWAFQVRSAQKEITQIDQQITAAQIRLQIAQKELDNQQLQIDQSKEVNQFMKSKFTNQQLYEWMISQISTVYFQGYQLAFDMAKRAERCFRYELGTPDATFIQSSYWDSLKKGLLAGEKLLLDLKRLDASYYDKNKREFEITKHISLNQIDPLALLKLKQNGVCFFTLPEEVFDLDYPGHYFRRIKSVALSVPCVIGPFNNVNCTLTVLKSRIRVSADAGNVDYQNTPTENDPGFTFNFSSIQQMVTSSGQNDTGMFETVLRDERYLPFEGHGAISEWKLELNKDFRNFDFSSISDVIIHIRYTARQGGAVLATKVKQELNGHLNNLIRTYEDGTGLFKLLSMKSDFSTEFHQLLHPSSATQQASFNLVRNHVPFWLSTRDLEVDNATAVTVLLKLKPGQTLNLNALNMQVNGQGVIFAPPASIGDLKQGSVNLSGDLFGAWTIGSTTTALDPSKIDDILLLVKYQTV